MGKRSGLGQTQDQRAEIEADTIETDLLLG